MFIGLCVALTLCSCSSKGLGGNNDYNTWYTELTKSHPTTQYKVGIGSCDIHTGDTAYALECARKQALLNLVNSISSTVEGSALLNTDQEEQNMSYQLKEESSVSVDDVKYVDAYMDNKSVSTGAVLDLKQFRESLIKSAKQKQEILKDANMNQARIALKELYKIKTLNNALYPDYIFVDNKLIAESQKKVDAYINDVKYFNKSKNPVITKAIQDEGLKLTNSPDSNDITINYVEHITSTRLQDGLYQSSGYAVVSLKSNNISKELKTDVFTFYGPEQKQVVQRLKTKLGMETQTILRVFLGSF